jgi:hypothetical protein
MTVELTEPEELPELTVAINVPDNDPPPHYGGDPMDQDEITVEMSLDGGIVVIVAWPHDGECVDRATLMQTLALAQQALPQILDQMEAPQ